jgi:hypothetical protein
MKKDKKRKEKDERKNMMMMMMIMKNTFEVCDKQKIISAYDK